MGKERRPAGPAAGMGGGGGGRRFCIAGQIKNRRANEGRAHAAIVRSSLLKEFVVAREIVLVHPGAILLEDWLKPLNVSQHALAQAICVSPRRINEIVKGLRGITVDAALRLGAFFGTDAQSWVNLQIHYDTERAREAMADVLVQIPRCEKVKF